MGWAWNKKAHRYYNTDTGRFLSRTRALEFVDQSLAASGNAVDLLAGYVADGMLAPADWYALMAEEIKGEYIRQYLLGRGGLSQMTQADWGSIGGMLKEQYSYLKPFAEQIAQGNLSEGQIRSRARMYVNSAREAYERANARAQSDGMLVLPAYPGDGQTVCLTNCACSWKIDEIVDEDGNVIGWDCYWDLGAAEHCPDCITNNQQWSPLEVRL
jgi:hypothetical protein